MEPDKRRETRHLEVLEEYKAVRMISGETEENQQVYVYRVVWHYVATYVL